MNRVFKPLAWMLPVAMLLAGCNGTDDDAKKQADGLLAFMTPIAKAFMTEVGFESANHGVQIYGGHGFIAEWGMEQNVRDSRISMLSKANHTATRLRLTQKVNCGSRLAYPACPATRPIIMYSAMPLSQVPPSLK